MALKAFDKLRLRVTWYTANFQVQFEFDETQCAHVTNTKIQWNKMKSMDINSNK